jgi:hypothetical protein
MKVVCSDQAEYDRLKTLIQDHIYGPYSEDEAVRISILENVLRTLVVDSGGKKCHLPSHS